MAAHGATRRIEKYPLFRVKKEELPFGIFESRLHQKIDQIHGYHKAPKGGKRTNQQKVTYSHALKGIERARNEQNKKPRNARFSFRAQCGLYTSADVRRPFWSTFPLNFFPRFSAKYSLRFLLSHGKEKAKMAENSNQGGSCLKSLRLLYVFKLETRIILLLRKYNVDLIPRLRDIPHRPVFHLRPVSALEVMQLLQALPQGKSVGPDTISNDLLKIRGKIVLWHY